MPAERYGLLILSAILGPLAGVLGSDPPPDFDFRLQAPKRVSGPPGAVVQFPAAVILRTTPKAAPSIGAEAWTLSIAASGGGRIVDATISGTAGDSPPAGYFSDGFRIAEVTEGPGNEGAISAVALYFQKAVTLPPQGDSVLLRLSVETEIPREGEPCRKVILEFHDGLKGAGLPVNNTITFNGTTRKDDGSTRDSDSDQEEDASILVCVLKPFSRGDCAVDQKLDITDPLTMLSYLFLGGGEPPCLGACDGNDDEEVNISDPVYLLNYLFLGGPPPPPPFPSCGLFEGNDPLGCAAYEPCN